MENFDPQSISTMTLLERHCQIAAELQRRGITRGMNNPTGDFAEYLFCKAMHWEMSSNSTKNYDAVGADGKFYQIKARRLTNKNTSRQLSAIRNLEGFDFLAGVLFDKTFGIQRAAIIPRAVVVEQSTYRKHVNGHVFHLRESVWDAPNVIEVTDKLRAVVT